MNLALIPSPSISSFQIGPLTVRFYALCILLGIFCAVWLTTIRWKKMGGMFDQILDVALVTVPAGIVGGRLYHVITTPELYFSSPSRLLGIFKVWNGGLGIWGAVVLGALAAWGWCRHRNYPFSRLADAVAPTLLVAQAIGRLGNWFNQELYGSPTTLPWGLQLNMNAYGLTTQEQCFDGSSCPTGTLFHPTFLYELLWNLIGAALIWWLTDIISKRFKSGSQFALYVMWYTAGRTWIEMLRIDFAHEFLGLRINVWVSLIVFMCAVMAFMFIQREGTDTDIMNEKLKAMSELETQVRDGKLSAHQLRLDIKAEREEKAKKRKETAEKQIQERDKKREELRKAKELINQKHWHKNDDKTDQNEKSAEEFITDSQATEDPVA